MDTIKKIKKTADKKTYMREYMRKYNKKRYGTHIPLTAEQKDINRRMSHKKYYNKNKDIIRKREQVRRLKNRIRICQEKLNSIEQ